MEKRLKVGIPGWKTGENSFGVSIHYLDYFSRLGEVVILLPSNEVTAIDLLVLPGGKDLDPDSYGEVPGYYTGDADVHKQYFYNNNLAEYILRGTAVFGICLGFQQLAAFFGSQLTQNLIYHPSSPARWQKGHEVFAADNALAKGFWPFKKQKVDVNSHHHQGVHLSELSGDLIALALAEDEDKNDPLVEAFIHHNQPIAGVQWHPEEWRDAFTELLIQNILKYTTSRPDRPERAGLLPEDSCDVRIRKEKDCC